MRPYKLQWQYDFVIGKALVDKDIASALLADPVSTSRSLGLCEEDATFLADIREKDLVAFARTLARRLSSAQRPGLDRSRTTERLLRASGE